MKFSQKKGFTLIELLVVVAIIGVLAAIVLSSLNSARSKARDARRESDIKSIQNTLELYYLDHGEYPRTSWAYSNEASWSTLESYLGDLPEDPKNTFEVNHLPSSTNNYIYVYFAHPYPTYCNGQAYALYYNKENADEPLTPTQKWCDGSLINGYGNAFAVGMSPQN